MLTEFRCTIHQIAVDFDVNLIADTSDLHSVPLAERFFRATDLVFVPAIIDVRRWVLDFERCTDGPHLAGGAILKLHLEALGPDVEFARRGDVNQYAIVAALA